MSKQTNIFGIVLTVAVALWDIDAMRPHIAAHSWVTLGYVALFLIGHVVDAVALGSISYSGSLKVLYATQ
jgi:hypothetical protein